MNYRTVQTYFVALSTAVISSVLTNSVAEAGGVRVILTGVAKASLVGGRLAGKAVASGAKAGTLAKTAVGAAALEGEAASAGRLVNEAAHSTSAASTGAHLGEDAGAGSLHAQSLGHAGHTDGHVGNAVENVADAASNVVPSGDDDDDHESRDRLTETISNPLFMLVPISLGIAGLVVHLRSKQKKKEGKANPTSTNG